MFNTRRGFLSFLTSAAAVASFDPERLLWTPGAKLISVPKPRLATAEQTISLMLEKCMPELNEIFLMSPKTWKRLNGFENMDFYKAASGSVIH